MTDNNNKLGLLEIVEIRKICKIENCEIGNCEIENCKIENCKKLVKSVTVEFVKVRIVF